MATWGVAQAKAQFSEMLDKAETEGPQLVTRRKRKFYLLTEEQKDQLSQPQETAKETKPFVSAWDALRPSSGECFDFDFPRIKSKPRVVKF